MKTILQIESVAYIGEVSKESEYFSQKLAEVYNNSFYLENISSEIDSGINFNFCNETKKLKKEYCKKDNILKVYLNEESYFAMPTIFSGKNVYNKFYNESHILEESLSLKENLGFNIAKGRILEENSFKSEESLVNEFYYLLKDIDDEKENLAEISLSSIKSLFSSKSKDKDNASDDKIQKKESEKSDLAFEEIVNQMHRLQKNKIKKSDQNKSDRQKKKENDRLKNYGDHGLTNAIKKYINLQGINDDEVFIDEIGMAFSKYFSDDSEDLEKSAKEALEFLTNKIKKSLGFNKVNKEIKTFINFQNEQTKVTTSSHLLNVKKLENKIQSIYKEYVNASSDAQLKTKSDTGANAEEKATKSFRGSIKKRKKEAQKASKNKKFSVKNLIMAFGRWLKNVITSCLNFMSLIYRNKLKTMSLVALDSGFTGFIKLILNGTAQLMGGIAKWIMGVIINYNSTWDYIKDESLKNEIKSKFVDACSSFFDITLEIVTNPLGALDDNFSKCLKAMNALVETGHMPETLTNYIRDLVATQNDWSTIPLNIYLLVILFIIITYASRNIIPILSHSVQLANALYKIVVSGFTGMNSDNITLPGYINFKTAEIDSFVTKAISGIDGIDGRIGQSVALTEVHSFITMMLKQSNAQDEVLNKKLSVLNKVNQIYLKELSKEFKPLESIKTEVGKKIRAELKKTAVNVQKAATRNV